MSDATPLHWVGWFLLISWAFFLLRIGLSLAHASDGTRASELRKTCTGLAIMAAGSAFVGFVFIAIGFGAIFPKITAIAAPLACLDGQFELVSQAYSYKPGQSGVTRNALCVHASGEIEVVTGLTLFYAGLVYTALLMTLWMWLKRLGFIGPKKAPMPPAEIRNDPARLAVWQKQQDEYAHSRQVFDTRWDTRKDLFRISGCGHEAVYACHFSRPERGFWGGRCQVTPAGALEILRGVR